MSTRQQDIYFASYDKYAGRLRLWLVAYGIGGPILMVSQPSVFEKLTGHDAAVTADLFLTGVLLQVVYLMIHKWTQWAQFIREPDDNNKKPIPKKKSTDGLGKLAESVSSAYVIDILADLGSFGFFFAGTILLVIQLSS